jgi:hypothetical protein
MKAFQESLLLFRHIKSSKGAIHAPAIAEALLKNKLGGGCEVAHETSRDVSDVTVMRAVATAVAAAASSWLLLPDATIRISKILAQNALCAYHTIPPT